MRKINPDDFQRATRDTPRQVNRRILLNLVRERQPISRADLARAMGVARGTMTALVNELLEAGLVREGETASVRRGRKPTLLHIRSHDQFVLGADVHRGSTFLLLSDLAGRELIREQFPTPSDSRAFVDALVPRVHRIADAHRSRGTFHGMGVVVPGVVDSPTGRILNAPTLGWRDLDLISRLQTTLDFPVHIERDAVACALARIWLGGSGGSTPDTFVYLAVSEGLGTGLVVNGQVVRGRHSAAGEFGHVALTRNGPRCSCGSRGCWEAYASDGAIVERYRSVGTGGGDGQGELTVREITRRAARGEERAKKTLLTTARYLAQGIATVVNALDPGEVVVGGEVAHAWDLIEPVIRREVEARALTPAVGATTLVPEAAHGEQRLLGAVALPMAPLFAAPRIA